MTLSTPTQQRSLDTFHRLSRNWSPLHLWGRGIRLTLWSTCRKANRNAYWRKEGGIMEWPGPRLKPRAVGVNFRSQVVVKQQLFGGKVVIMSNNNASNNLIIAQRAVKQLRLEASVRRIKVEPPKPAIKTRKIEPNYRWMAETQLLLKWHRPDFTNGSPKFSLPVNAKKDPTD